MKQAVSLSLGVRAGVRVAIAALALLTSTPTQAQPQPWDAKWYNEKPAEADLVMPLPCGAGMTFRPVRIALPRNPLSDRPLTLGEPQPAQGYLSFQHEAFLAAPFPAGDNARVFYMAKYDVTRDQYAAIRGDCPEPSGNGRLPQTAVSWLDAVQASSQLTSWWLANARDQLPRRGDQLGYARLPTEDEWEYAARGGDQVAEDLFLAPTWPMPEGVAAYAHAGAQRSGGRPRQVGALLPNPLKLYDMLGNVQQLMLEPFRLNRVGRPHGQAGGIVVRGGSFRSPLDALHTAMRDERPPFDARRNAPTTFDDVGFRLVISGPSLGSLVETTQAQEAFDAESGQRNAPLPEDATQLLAVLRAQVNETARRGLDRVGARLADLARERADRDRLVIGVQLEAAAAMGNYLWVLESRARFAERQVDTTAKGHPDEQAVLRASADRFRADQQPTLDGYLRLIRSVATNPQRAEIEAQSGVLREELQARRQAGLLNLLAVATKHATARRDGQTLPRDQALQAIVNVPAAPASPSPPARGPG